MKTLLIVIALSFSFPMTAFSIAETSINDDWGVDHPREVNNPARKGNLGDELRKLDYPLQDRTPAKTKLSRDKNRAQNRGTPAQNCDPNDMQCMRTQDVNAKTPR